MELAAGADLGVEREPLAVLTVGHATAVTRKPPTGQAAGFIPNADQTRLIAEIR